MLPKSNFVNTLATAALLLLPIPAAAQWRVDADFDPGHGASELVWSARGQADGSVLAVGRFTQAGGAPRGGIARFLPDGSLDPNFAPSANGTVLTVLPLQDGGILVGGSFNHIVGQPITGLARLDATGALDLSFQPQIGGTVFSVLELADGRLMVAGFFNQAGGAPCGSIARLFADGSRDSSFDTGWGADSYILSMALDMHGRILVGGYFNWLNGQPRSRLARLWTNGFVDPNFQPSANAPVHAIAVQADGKILVGGDFTQLNGQPAGHLGRLLTTGETDPSWQGGGADAAVAAIAVETTGNILVGGAFTSIAGAPRGRLARLLPTGVLDAGFTAEADGLVQSISLAPDRGLLLGGDFLTVGGIARTRVARLDLAPSHDPAYAPQLFHHQSGGYEIQTLVPTRDRRLLVGGGFQADSQFPYLARLNQDGTLDRSFKPSPSARVSAALEQRDGKIVVAGPFGNIGGGYQPFLARLTPAGQLDRTFTLPRVGHLVFALAQQPDDKLLIGGPFYYFHPHYRRGVARLEANGSLDLSFDTGAGPEGTVQVLAVQADGKILAGGSFTGWNGEPRRGLVRLLADGSLDADFAPVLDSGWVTAIQVAADGSIVIGGNFRTVDGVPRPGMARLFADGSVDPDFASPFQEAGATTTLVRMINQRADGHYLVAGALYLADGSVSALLRLRPDGRLDELIAHPSANWITAMAIEADGNLVAGGIGSIPTGTPGDSRKLIRYRLDGGGSQRIEVPAAGDAVRWLRHGGLPELAGVQFELSTDGQTFLPLGHAEKIDGAWQLEGLALPTGLRIVLRASGFAASGQLGASLAYHSQTRSLTLD